jgi:hypothetical protein
MPLLSFFYITEFDPPEFLGTCEYTRRLAFEERLKAWCVAYDKTFESVKATHHYLGGVV